MGYEAVTLEVPWGEAVKPGDVAAALARDDSIRGVCVQACETSTGAAHDVRALGEIVKAHPEALLLVDAVSALVRLTSAWMSGGSMPSSPAHKRP